MERQRAAQGTVHCSEAVSKVSRGSGRQIVVDIGRQYAGACKQEKFLSMRSLSNAGRIDQDV